VYFAFKVTRTPYTAQASSCPDWVRSPPRLKDGVSLVGRSKESKNESSARSGALADAQKQLWQMTGADLSEGSGIEPREWCVETRTSEEGDVRYVGNVLVAVSGASLEALKSQGGAPGVTPAPAAATTPEPAGGGAPGGVLARANALPGVTLPGKKESREVATAGPRPVLPALAGREVPSAEAPGGAPLTDADVAPIVQALNKQPYSKDKLVVLRDRVSGRPLTAMQAATLLRCFANGFPDVQFEALVVLAPAITDRANAQLGVETFWMGVYAAKAEQLLKQGPHPNASPAHRAP
jgi:hypothetical protein